MALYRVEAVIIKTKDLGEADRLVTSYTRQKGRHRAVARGARRPRSRLAAGVQPFVHSQLLCWGGRTLDGISQCQVVNSHRPLRESLEGMAAAAVACELVDAFAQEEDPEPRAFELLLAGLRTLEGVVPRGVDALDRVLTSFQWKLLAIKGFRPVLHLCAGCGDPSVTDQGALLVFSPAEGGLLCRECAGAAGDRAAVRVAPQVPRIIARLIGQPLAAAAGLDVTADIRGQLAAAGRAFLHWTLDRELQSRDFFDLLAFRPPGRSSGG